jgi:hypothetical protein
MDQVKATLKEKTAILDPYAKQIPPVVDLAKQVDINPGTILGGILFVFGLILMLF